MTLPLRANGESKEPSHVCLDCGALGYAGGYHDHGGGNAGDTVALTELPRLMSALHDIEMERDMTEAWNKRLVSALRVALSTMEREMLSDESCDRPFNEDMAEAIGRAKDVLTNG